MNPNLRRSLKYKKGDVVDTVTSTCDRDRSQLIIIIIIIIIIAKQCWFVDDAFGGAGPLEEVKQWWDWILSQFQEVLACC